MFKSRLPYMENNLTLTTFSYNTNHKNNLIFIHGFLCSASIWEVFVNSFKKDNNIYLVHLPGHTGSAETIISVKEIATNLKIELQTNKVRNPHIIGHSLGGYIAGELSQLMTIKSLTLINSSLLADSEEKKADRLKAIRSVKIAPTIFSKSVIENLFLKKNIKDLNKVINTIQQNAKKIKRDTIVSYLEAIKNRNDTTHNIINIPTHYISSIQDSTIPYKLIKQQVSNNKHYLTTLHHSNHMSFIEESDKVSKAINSFFVSFTL